MNIFVLSLCSYLCARYHCDKHVVKMILETAQFDTVNSPYYTQVQIDPNYLKFMQGIANCK